MDFSYTPIKFRSPALEMQYFLVPWDAEILGRPVAQLSQISVHDDGRAEDEFKTFQDWRNSEQVQLCACRLRHDRLQESMFLQRHGFRFIELNYRPYLGDLQQRKFSADSIKVLPAKPEDEDELAHMASTIFQHGRFHQDPGLGVGLGNRRYEIWLHNSFALPSQTPYKCVHGEKIVGFFVVEYPQPNASFWSLIGLAPRLQGQGWGTRVWQAMALFHQTEGMNKIETSISSHNAAIFNLYAKLGFRFPLPEVTFHWHAQ